MDLELHRMEPEVERHKTVFAARAYKQEVSMLAEHHMMILVLVEPHRTKLEEANRLELAVEADELEQAEEVDKLAR